MKIVVIDYNAGNIQSVLFALQRAGVEGFLSSEPEEIRSADRIIFPGVGEAGSAMKYLAERKLDKLILSLEQPVLGICLGMQLLCMHSEESDTPCIGIFDTRVRKFPPGKLKVPHVGWNYVEREDEKDFYYFVHSYYADICDHTIGTTSYDIRFSSILRRKNFMGVQFHPEKSGEAGAFLIKKFLEQ